MIKSERKNVYGEKQNKFYPLMFLPEKITKFLTQGSDNMGLMVIVSMSTYLTCLLYSARAPDKQKSFGFLFLRKEIPTCIMYFFLKPSFFVRY